MNKLCLTCQIEKPICLFRKKRNKCRECEKIYSKNYRINNSDKIKENNKNYYWNNRLSELNRVKSYAIKNSDKVKENNKNYYWKNKIKELNRTKEYKLLNKDKINKTRREYSKSRKKTDACFKLRKTISDSIYLAIKQNKNNKSILEYLPYTIQELKDHIEKQFEVWMNWNNWGKYSKSTWDDNDCTTWTWQIDHIIPHSKFNYTNMEDENFKKCWSLNNLRPYSSKQNLLDSNMRFNDGYKF